MFGAAGQPVAAGLCDLRCDPLTQRLLDGSGQPDPTREACGSPHPASGSGSASKGPELLVRYTADFVDFVCEQTPEGRGSDLDQRTRGPCSVHLGEQLRRSTQQTSPPAAGQIRDSSRSSSTRPAAREIDCTRLCAPLESDITMPAANAKGDATATGKLPGRCESSRRPCRVSCGQRCPRRWRGVSLPVAVHGRPDHRHAQHLAIQRYAPGCAFELREVQVRPGPAAATRQSIEPSCTTLKAGSRCGNHPGPRNVVCAISATVEQVAALRTRYAVFHGCYKLADSMFASNKHAEVVAPKQLAGRFHAYLGDAAKLRRVGGIR